MKKVETKRIKYLLLGIIVALIGCKKCPPPVENERRDLSSLTISYNPTFNKNPLNIKAFGNINMHNEDILISNWGIIMSDVSLIKEDNTKIKLGDGYMYVNLASSNPSFTFTNIPEGNYKGIAYNIGVDSLTNHSDPVVWGPMHPLNINFNSQHWGWAGGYIFHTIEGKYKPSGSTSESGFSYHTAKDPLLSSHEYILDFALSNNTPKVATIEADANKFFSNELSFTSQGTNHSGSAEDMRLMSLWVKNMDDVFTLNSVE